MSHQRYPSIDPVKEPHSVSLKVLRLSRPSLVAQHPLHAPFLSSAQNPHHDTTEATALMPASLAYGSKTIDATDNSSNTNSAPFLLAPILNLPPSFGSAYVGETFSCTLCANHDIPPDSEPASGGSVTQLSAQQQQQQKKRFIRDVRIEAEMKTPGSGSTVQKLVLGPSPLSLPSRKQNEEQDDDDGGEDGGSKKGGGGGGKDGTDLDPNQTLQRIVNFDLKEEGNHVLAVTVSYYEATETSGRTRTFRKLYQFICKGSLIVRTKISPLPLPLLVPSSSSASLSEKGKKGKKDGEGKSKPRSNWKPGRSWAMEAQLENCSEDVMQLERVGLDLEPGLRYADCNYWGTSASTNTTASGGGGSGAVMNNKPVLHPGEVEQCCFVVAEEAEGAATLIPEEWDGTGGGRVVFGVLGIGWRSEMGNKGFLTTGKLGTRVPGAVPAAAAAAR